jgi:hypothetical protein
MSPEHFEAVRRLRDEADKLRLACIDAAGNSSLMHIAFDSSIADKLPTDQVALLGRLNNIR